MKVKCYKESIVPGCLFASGPWHLIFGEVPINFFEVFIYLVIVNLLEHFLLGKGNDGKSLLHQVLVKGYFELHFDLVVLNQLLILPFIIQHVLPSDILLQSLLQHTSQVALIVPQLHQLVSPWRQQEFLFTLVHKTDVSNPFIMSLNLQFLSDILWRHNDFTLLVRKVMNVNW